MPIPPSPQKVAEYIWIDGDFVPWEDAKIHVLSHVLHYGSSVFEGIRCYETPDGPKVFRLHEHIHRLFYSARVARMEIPFREDEIVEVSLESIRKNAFDACYIRPLVFRGAGGMGILPKGPIHVMLATWEWGAYLGKDAVENGIDVMVSSWRKMAPGTMPALTKLGGAYCLATIAKLEAARLGFSEALLMDVDGRVAEGTGENIFAVYDGRVITPPLSHSVLGGITRKSVIQLAKDHGFEVVEQPLTRDFLYMAHELFFSGTAAEVTPIRSVDRLPIGAGVVGPITKNRHGWLTLAATGAKQP
jgi:branched-chain amino acid aminotransferase